MVVNSIAFWLFFTVVIIPYFFLRGKQWQNSWLLLASYFFYGWADWKMLPLLLIVTLIYYFLGIEIANNNKANPKKASVLTICGVVFGVCILLYFKYLNFFIDSFCLFFKSFGFQCSITTLNILMPLGISFFTFKLISYAIEIHRGNISPERDLITWGAYVAFFPTILSGPIDRPTAFLPQLRIFRSCKEEMMSEGMKRILWGMFMKLCIADRFSPYTDAVFNNCANHNLSSIIVASMMFFVQMYADFCGYSHMAIGVSQMLGLRVTENFNRPFFAKNVAEYWRRWHISLTTWITDYIFMPLNIKFRDMGMLGVYMATIINLVVIGAWHGANWTYVIFGLYHGLLLVFVTANDKRRKKLEKRYSLKNKEWYIWTRRGLTFVLCSFGCLLFRANNIEDVGIMLSKINDGFGMIYHEEVLSIVTFGLLSVLIMLYHEYNREYNRNIGFLHSKNLKVRIASASFLIIFILLTGSLNGGDFIYFQF